MKFIRTFDDRHNIDSLSYADISEYIREEIRTSGLNVGYKKRDKFYGLFLSYHNIENFKIKSKIDIGGEILSDFYFLSYNI